MFYNTLHLHITFYICFHFILTFSMTYSFYSMFCLLNLIISTVRLLFMLQCIKSIKGVVI